LEQLVGTERSRRLLVQAAAALDAPRGGATAMWRDRPSTDEYGTVTPHHATDVPIPTPTLPGYEVVQELGRGGMGVVYLARHLALNRQVALKMILGGAYADAKELARFRAEAEAVAKFTHPHIVQIFDVGTLEGMPYCALELLTGGSLDEQLRGQPQPPRQAATLLVPVAQAVQAAHDQGILHRDLKPSNILLTADGTPKLTDFGLAKRLEDDNGQTRTGEIVGTPGYMAPEQAAGKVRQLGPATDIYALGAILYQLLTGRPPFQGLSALDTVMQVMTTEPIPPRQLQPTVPRDLETICLKCLHKEPAKRYPSAQALAADLQNYLDGKPILARPAGRWERAVKWCRRYPTAAALLLVVTLAALGMALLAAWALQAEQTARQESAQKEEQRRKAVEQAELAQAVTRFLRYDVLLLANPATQLQDRLSDRKYDAEVKLRDVVKRAGKAIEGKFTNQPQVEAELRSTLGITLLSMGQFDLALPHLERLRTLCMALYGSDHPDTLASLVALSNCYDELSRHAEALKLREQIKAHYLATHGPDHAETLMAMLHMANSYDSLGRHAEAVKLNQDTHTRFRATLGPEDYRTYKSLSNLANSYFLLGQHAEAAKLQGQALSGLRTTLGPNHPETLGAVLRLANCYDCLGQSAEAIGLLEDAQSRFTNTLGVDHLNTLGCLMNLANCYAAVGRFDKAQATGRDLIARLEERQRRHPDEKVLVVMLAGAYCNLGYCLTRDHKPADALPWYAKGQQLLEKCLAQEPRDATARHYLCNVHFCRAKALEQLQRYAEADANWAKAISLSPPHEGPLMQQEQARHRALRPKSTGQP
jgi:tetratricopeptide (TPR) repeat protein